MIGTILYREEFEIIIVNDGSTDSTVSKVISFFKNYDFDYIIHNQTNLGLSEARNNGLRLAKAKYVWFVDSDDEIICNEINLLIDSLNDEMDLIFFPIVKKENHEERIENHYFTNNRLIGAPFYIFNKSFLIDNNLFFFPNIIHEDLEFLPRVFSLVKTYFKFDFPLYKNISTKNSITTSKVNFFRVKSLLDISIKHYESYLNQPNKCFKLYTLVSINTAFLLSFKLDSNDKVLLTEYLKAHIKLINLLLKVKIRSVTKIKSVISIIYFNLLSIK